MCALHELQRGFARGLLAEDLADIVPWIDSSRHNGVELIAIHRRNMDGALAKALQLTYPAVEALVGEAFFRQAAAAFTRQHLPRAALLDTYGDAFPSFLAAYAGASSLPYLQDVAHLEWAVAQAALAPAFGEAPPCGVITLASVTLCLAPSLTLVRTAYPAEAIWRAVLARDETGLAAIDPSPAASTLAVWRAGAGAAVTRLSDNAAAFVGSVMDTQDREAAIGAIIESGLENNAVESIVSEVLQAGFSRLDSGAAKHDSMREDMP